MGISLPPENPIQNPVPIQADCWHLVALGPGPTGHTGSCAVRLVGFQDGVRGAEVAGSGISVNVMASRTRGAGGAHIRGF